MLYSGPSMGVYSGSFSDMLGCEGPAAGARVFNDGRFTYEPLADAARLADEVVLLNCLLTCSHCLSVRLAQSARQHRLISLGLSNVNCASMRTWSFPCKHWAHLCYDSEDASGRANIPDPSIGLLPLPSFHAFPALQSVPWQSPCGRQARPHHLPQQPCTSRCTTALSRASSGVFTQRFNACNMSREG